MKVFLLKDVERIGMAGQMISVTPGYATNFLFPKKLAVEITPENEKQFLSKIRIVEKHKEVVATKTSMLAEKIKHIELKIKRKMADGDKLYGSISAGDIVDLFAAEGISVAKNQIEFGKSIKTKGLHEFTVKLSSTLKPVCTIKVIPE